MVNDHHYLLITIPWKKTPIFLEYPPLMSCESMISAGSRGSEGCTNRKSEAQSTRAGKNFKDILRCHDWAGDLVNLAIRLHDSKIFVWWLWLFGMTPASLVQTRVIDAESMRGFNRVILTGITWLTTDNRGRSWLPLVAQLHHPLDLVLRWSTKVFPDLLGFRREWETPGTRISSANDGANGANRMEV